MTNLNKSADPLLHRLPQIASDLEGTVKHANQLVGSLDDSHGPGSSSAANESDAGAIVRRGALGPHPGGSAVASSRGTDPRPRRKEVR